jgi:hypothetical protein
MMQPPATTDQATGLIDIEPPSAPPTPPLQAALAGAGLAVALGIALFALWRRRRSPRVIARRRLARLRARHAGGRISGREAAYESAALLRSGLGLRQLKADTCPAGSGDTKPRWTQFIRRLDDARYAPGPPAQAAIDDLLAETAAWLGRTP